MEPVQNSSANSANYAKLSEEFRMADRMTFTEMYLHGQKRTELELPGKSIIQSKLIAENQNNHIHNMYIGLQVFWQHNTKSP